MIIIAKTKTQIKKFCKLGIRHHLYQNQDWQMFYSYNNPGCILSIGMYFENNIPISCCIFILNKSYALQTYTNIEKRKKGIGRALVSAMYSEFGDHPRTWAKGIPGSEMFYRKVLNEN